MNQMEIIAKTHIGNLREVNQDYVQYFQKNDNECIAVLCDGMGGHNAGEVASALTCQDIINQYQYAYKLDSDEDIQVWMSQAIYHANTVVKEQSMKNQDMQGMGTTVVVVVVKNNRLHISHVGDSRAYYYNHGELKQLTKDDTLVNALVDSGTITPQEAMYHPQKNILLQAVGVSDVMKISYYVQGFDEGIIMLCSDGLYNSLTNHQMIEMMDRYDVLEDIGECLINEANHFGGKDNIGLILMKNKGVNE